MPPKAPNIRGYFCFTHNNWAEDDAQEYEQLFEAGYFRYLMYGKEVAPSTGTPHLQGFFWTSEAKQLAVVKNKKKFKGAWITVPGKEKGLDYWVAYCSKEDVDMVQFGIKPTQDELLGERAGHHPISTPALAIVSAPNLDT